MCQEKPNQPEALPHPGEEGPPPRPLADEALRPVTGGMRPIAACWGIGEPQDSGTPGT